MFEYLLMPLDTHFDHGFGATADAYKDAAEMLSEGERSMNGHLPIRFLLRHAIELYLKSGIIIFHRKLRLPYGDRDDAAPMIRRTGGWQPMQSVHSVGQLYSYWSQLFCEHADYLSKNTKTDWSMPPELPGLIKLIDDHDPGSTLYRYPVTKDPQKDKRKSSSQRMQADSLLDHMKAKKGPAKVMLMFDENDALVDAYDIDADVGSRVGEALVKVAETLSCTHAAMRGELTHGL
jgi:hypothetical protein